MAAQKIAVGSDHAGFALKESLKAYLQEKGYEIEDFGVVSSKSSDYPDVAFPVAEAVAKKKVGQAVLVCGSGVGVSISANKVPGVRAVLCESEEVAQMGRSHNDGNVLALGGRRISLEKAKRIVDVWFATPFSGEGPAGARHARRLQKIADYELQR